MTLHQSETGEKALTARAYAAGSLYLVGEIKSLMSEEE